MKSQLNVKLKLATSKTFHCEPLYHQEVKITSAIFCSLFYWFSRKKIDQPSLTFVSKAQIVSPLVPMLQQLFSLLVAAWSWNPIWKGRISTITSLILKAFCAFSKNKLPLWGGQLYRALSLGLCSFGRHVIQHDDTQHAGLVCDTQHKRHLA